MSITAAERLIVALDFADVSKAEATAAELIGTGCSFKIGFETLLSGGLGLAENLIARECSVFLDMKLLDIPNTVEKAAAAAARLGVRFLTVHGYPFALEAARRGIDSVEGARTNLLSVTVMTSVTQDHLQDAGYETDTRELIKKRALQAKDIGADGLILSAQDIAPLREIVGKDVLFVTPGIRPVSSDIGDQARVMDPKTAIRSGSDFLVVGRPITQADDRLEAATHIIADIERGLAQ